jgi:hypothetical protein
MPDLTIGKVARGSLERQMEKGTEAKRKTDGTD